MQCHLSACNILRPGQTRAVCFVPSCLFLPLLFWTKLRALGFWGAAFTHVGPVEGSSLSFDLFVLEAFTPGGPAVERQKKGSHEKSLPSLRLWRRHYPGQAKKAFLFTEDSAIKPP